MSNFFLYNRQSYAAQERDNMITITIGKTKMKDADDNNIEKNGTVIRAVMQEDFKFGTKANWEQVMKAGGFSDTIEKAMLLTGNKVQNAGGITKLYYMGSEHIPVSTKFRIFADENPLIAVKALSELCLPATGASIEEFLDKGVKTIEVGLEAAGSAAKDLLTGKGLLAALHDLFSKLTADVGNEICHVQFGKWLSGIFVLKSVDFTYSREIGTNGQPYYVDFDVSFESLMIPIKSQFSTNDNAMLKLGQSTGSRVTFDNAP